MAFTPPQQFNIADYFLGDRVREGGGGRRALITDSGTLTYADVHVMANRYANVLLRSGVEPEQRVIIALPDGPEFVAALFAILRIGAVVVMVNPELAADAIEYFYRYTRAVAAFVHVERLDVFDVAAEAVRDLRSILVVGSPEHDAKFETSPGELAPYPTHRDDAAIWLFSGGTTGRPKAVVQTHRSFANTTECYAKGVLGYTENDVTLSVPKLYFGYATGSNLFFPFAVGGAAALFAERCTAECLFAQIDRVRPTILVNVPTMIKKLVSHPRAAEQDLSCLRLATSAGEALPPELHARWDETFGVELLDGLGTAEMWHIFISNRPGDVHPGTLGKVVPGFEVKVCDDEGRALPDGETGWLWVRGDSRGIGYWQDMEKTRWGFRGEWYVSGDMITRDAGGVFSYRGRADDMLKVSGKWLATREVEECLLGHENVRDVAVVGVVDDDGLTKPHAFVVASADATPALAESLKAFVRERLEPYKYPREVLFLDELPRTHLGKVDRGKLRSRS